MSENSIPWVQQVGFYDLYTWNSRVELVRFRSLSRLDAVLREIRRQESQGRQVFVRQNLAGRAQWSQYSVLSSSHLGYFWNQELDKIVARPEDVRGAVHLALPVQLSLPLDFEGVSHG